MSGVGLPATRTAAMLTRGLAPRDRSGVQLLGQECHHSVEGGTGRVPGSSTSEMVSTNAPTVRCPPRCPARNRSHPLEGCTEICPQRLESLRRAPAVVGEPEPEPRRSSSARAVMLARSSASRPRAARPPFPIGAGMAGWLITEATTAGSRAVANANPAVKRIPTTPTPAHHVTVGRCGRPRAPDHRTGAVGRLRELTRHAHPYARSQDLAAIRRGCGPPEERRQVTQYPAAMSRRAKSMTPGCRPGISWTRAPLDPNPP